MRQYAIAGFALAGAIALCGPAEAEIVDFDFMINGDQAGTDSSAVGAASLQYDTLTQEFDLDLMVFGIGLSDLQGAGPNGTPIHLHEGAPGVNGGIVFDIGFFGSFVNDGLGIRFQLDDQLLGGPQGGIPDGDPNELQALLFSQELYVNIHTQDYPGGEVRGQVIPAPGALAMLGLAGVAAGRRRRRA